MFRSITQNPDPRVGKIFGPGSFVGKSTTFAPGRADWNTDYVTHMDRSFIVSILKLKYVE